MQYIQAILLTKQNFFWCFDAGLEHMAARSRGNGTNFDWLRKSCDISTCDLSPDGNREKYGRPMKSAINPFPATIFSIPVINVFCFLRLLRILLKCTSGRTFDHVSKHYER